MRELMMSGRISAALSAFRAAERAYNRSEGGVDETDRVNQAESAWDDLMYEIDALETKVQEVRSLAHVGCIAPREDGKVYLQRIEDICAGRLPAAPPPDVPRP